MDALDVEMGGASAEAAQITFASDMADWIVTAEGAASIAAEEQEEQEDSLQAATPAPHQAAAAATPAPHQAAGLEHRLNILQ